MTLKKELVDAVIKCRDRGIRREEAARELGLTSAKIMSICHARNIRGWPVGAAARDQQGSKNPMFKNGQSRATIGRTTKQVLLDDRRDLFTCERCRAHSSIEWPRHHRDRNRNNNNANNLEVLCVSCHNKEHMAERTRDALGRLT